MNLTSIIKNLYQQNPNLPFRNIARSIYWRRYGSPKRLYRSFKDVNSTEPLPCNPASQTELHTLTCHDHVYMYITSVKSLLRFVSDIAVVVHDDGSLTNKDIGVIQHHIRGIKVIRRSEADEILRDRLMPYPRTATYRAEVSNALELTDHAQLADKEKVIITNSDTLFLWRPHELIRWISATDRYVLCVYESHPVQQAEFLTRMESSFPPHLTLALVCFYRNMIDLADIEKLLGRVNPADSAWFIGQNSLPVLIGKKIESTRIEFLDRELYQASGVFTDGAVFRHYWTSIESLRPQYCAHAAKVIEELRSSVH